MTSRTTLLLFAAAAILTLSYCKGKKVLIPGPETVSFEKHLLPVLKDRCTPCHFPETGKKVWLDTYAANKSHIDDILRLIQLPKDDPDFMPFKNKKPALSDSLVQLFKDWKAQGMAK